MKFIRISYAVKEASSAIGRIIHNVPRTGTFFCAVRMFTGIISHVGTIKEKNATGLAISISPDLSAVLSKSGSIAVNGVCLTIIDHAHDFFSVDLMPETWQKTALGNLTIGDLTNLELPMSASGRFEGHIVQGHVDGTGTITSIKEDGNSKVITFRTDPSLSRFMIEKGSVAVNGISLTIISAGKDFFTVGIIPYTWSHTMLHAVKPGSLVNIEVDILAKYLQKFIAKGSTL